jgi:uncharacterized protein YndB with AHSA1/START domain
MTDTATETLSVVVERDVPYPPEKIWRALTQPHLIEAWLMRNDFEPVVDRPFKFSADWGHVDCRVLEAEPHTTLAYSWAANGVDTVVTWTLTPTGAGTHLRMEQSGFRKAPGHAQFYSGALHGWQRFFGSLEEVLARPET